MHVHGPPPYVPKADGARFGVAIPELDVPPTGPHQRKIARVWSYVVARRAFLGAIILFRVALDFCYVFYLRDAFENDRITPMPLNISATQVLISYLLLLPMAMIIPADKKNLNGIFFLTALAFLYIPVTSIVGLNTARPVTSVLLAGLAVLTSCAVILFGTVRLAIPVLRNGFVAAVAVSMSVVGAFVLWSIVSGAVYQANFNLGNIYLFREEASRVLDPGAMAYINLWAQKVFNPFLLAVGLIRRQRWLVVGCVALQFYFFVVTQHRTHLFVPILVFAVYLLYTRNISISLIYVLMGAGLLATLLASLLLGLEQAPAIAIRRAFFVAGSVMLDWIAFFEGYPKVYFSDNLLKGLIENEYTGHVLPLLMSELVFGDPPFGFNAGLVGVGFAQLGVAGIVLYAALLGIFVRVINGFISNGVPVFIAAAIMFEPLRTAWADSDLPTALLSHGLLVGAALLWVHGSGRTVSSSRLAGADAS
jgi:hypothetical protein